MLTWISAKAISVPVYTGVNCLSTMYMVHVGQDTTLPQTQHGDQLGLCILEPIAKVAQIS